MDHLVDHFLAPFRARKPSERTTSYVIVRGAPGEPPFAVHRDGRCVQRALSLTTIADFVLAEVTIEAVGRAEDFLVLHAAAASWADQGIVFPAPPDHGKSTLVAALTRAGFSYLTDEASLIDPATGVLHPFPRALWFEPPTLEMFPEVRERLPAECRMDGRLHYQVRPEDIRPGSAGRPCQIKYVVAPEYRRGSETVLEPMTRAAAVRTLAENSFNFGSFGAEGLALLRDVIAEAECYRLYVGDLDRAVSTVKALVGAKPSPRLTTPGLAEGSGSGSMNPDDELGLGETLSISEALVVSPAWGRVKAEPLEKGQPLEEGAIIGRLHEGADVTPLVCHTSAVFLAWLVHEGDRVSPGTRLARVRLAGA